MNELKLSDRPSDYSLATINNASEEQRARWLRGGENRIYSQALEFSPGDRLTVKEYRQPDGSKTYMVKPRVDGKGNYDAGGYRYYRSTTTGGWVSHQNDDEMSLAQYLENAFLYDDEVSARTEHVMKDYGLDDDANHTLSKLIADHLFVSGPKTGEELLRKKSKTLRSRFDSLVSLGVPKSEAFGIAWLSEADTYHKGNTRRVLKRSSDVYKMLSGSKNKTTRDFLLKFIEGRSSVKINKFDRNNTLEAQQLEQHRRAQKALADAIDLKSNASSDDSLTTRQDSKGGMTTHADLFGGLFSGAPADPLRHVSPDEYPDARDEYEEYPDLRILDGSRIRNEELKQVEAGLRKFNEGMVKGTAGTAALTSGSLPAAAVIMGAGTTVGDWVGGGDLSDAAVSGVTDAALTYAGGKVLEAGFNHVLRPVYKSVKNEVGKIIQNVRGRGPQVILPMGERGLENATHTLADAPVPVRNTLAEVASTRSVLPGEVAPTYSVSVPLSAQGRVTLDTGASWLDRLAVKGHSLLHRHDSSLAYTNERLFGQPLDRLLGRSPGKTVLTAAYPKGTSGVYVDAYKGSTRVPTLGQYHEPISYQPDNSMIGQVRINLNMTSPVDANPSEVLSHEYVHALARRSEGWLHSRGGKLLDGTVDPVVLNAAKVYSQKHPERDASVFLKDTMYGTQVHENTARYFNLLNRFKARSLNELESLATQTGNSVVDELGRPILRISPQATQAFPFYRDAQHLQQSVPHRGVIPLEHLDSKGGESGAVRTDSKGGNAVRADLEGGESTGESVDSANEVPEGTEQTAQNGGGPRIVVNPKVFSDKRDALCVAMNEAFRVLMEVNGFEPQAEPTPAQRRFFADTAYATDELMLRRTILARICTFDTSIGEPSSGEHTGHSESTAPTDEQLQEAVEFLETVMEIGAPQNQWEQQAVKRIHDVLVETLKSSQRTDTADQPAPRSETVHR